MTQILSMRECRCRWPFAARVEKGSKKRENKLLKTWQHII